MALRSPPAGLDPRQAMPVPEERWESYDCELVTPLYGGGVTAGEVDEKMPVRASAIRGQLRFWWRLLARHQRKLMGDELRQREFDLWGGLGKAVQASKLWLRVSGVRGIEPAPWAEYTKNWNGAWKSLPDPEAWANAPYALFPAQGKKPGLPDSQLPAELAKPGLQWRIEMSFAKNCSAVQKAECIEALRWWASFGGLGARSRRGLGAVRVQGLNAVDDAEAAAAGCTLVFGAAARPAATPAWIDAIEKLQRFRQGENVGRNPGATCAYAQGFVAERFEDSVRKALADNTERPGVAMGVVASLLDEHVKNGLQQQLQRLLAVRPAVAEVASRSYLHGYGFYKIVLAAERSS